MTHKPWLKFYPVDWRADPRLRMCSLAARGLWIDLISYMHEGQPYGHLTIDGAIPSEADIASLVARPLGEVRKALAELEARQVSSRSETGAIYSRRMVRDYEKALRDSENGKGGGNPSLKPGVNPPDKAQKPDTRNQISESHSQRLVGFKNAGEVKSGWTPPRHGATGKGRTYIEAGTPEWEAHAADFEAVRGFRPSPNKHGGKWFKTLGEGSPDLQELRGIRAQMKAIGA